MCYYNSRQLGLLQFTIALLIVGNIDLNYLTIEYTVAVVLVGDDMTSSTSNTGDIPTDALAEPGPDWPAAKKIWGLAW